MNNRVLLAALAGGVAAFFLGWLVWGILLKSTMESMNPHIEGAWRSDEEMVLWAMIVGNLIYGLIPALVFSRWANISTFKGGLIGGAWLFGLIALSYDLMFFAMSNFMSLNGILLDVVASVVVGGLTSGVVGWVLGYKR